MTWIFSAPITAPRGHFVDQFPDVGHHAGDCRGGNHRGTHEQRAARRTPLPPLEVPVGRGRAHLVAFELVGVHPEAHRAASVAPIEAGLPEGGVEPFALRRLLHRHRAGDDERLHAARDVMAADDASGFLEIGEAAVGARPDEGDVDLHARDRLAGGQPHVGERVRHLRVGAARARHPPLHPD